MPNIILNRIKTPDGTVLTSWHRHDYKVYTDEVSGENYMVDGGLSYLRRNVNAVPAEELTVYDDVPHAELREAFHWGTRGVDGKQPLTWVPLKSLLIDHIKEILRTQRQLDSSRVKRYFERELVYRGIK